MMDIIWIAFGLFLVFEGIMPTLMPAAYRRMLAMVSQQGDGSLRIVGLTVMVMGTIIIFLAKN